MIMTDGKYAGLDFCDVSKLYGFNMISPDTMHHNVRVHFCTCDNCSVHCV